MPLESRDAAYLWDIVETSRAVREFTAGVKPNEYRADRKPQMAVERAIEIIGEAARRISEPVARTMTECLNGRIAACALALTR